MWDKPTLHIPTTPNTNAVLDPAFAKAETERVFRAQLDVARDMCDYGALLLMRCFSTSERSFDNAVLIAMQFRQVVAMLDAVVCSLENGAVYAADVPLRALMEAAWTLEWMVLKGTQEDRRRYYVAFLRAQRSWLKSLVPGTPEHHSLEASLRGSNLGKGLAMNPGAPAVKRLRDGLREIDNLLRRKRYRAVNARFTQRTRKPGQDVEWYKVGVPGSLRVLTRDIHREEEYAWFYRSFSYVVHGSAVKRSIDVSDHTLTIEPIRNVQGFEFAFRMALNIAFRMFRLMLQRYRSGELDVYTRTYLEKWRSAWLNVPHVTIKTEPTMVP